MENFELYSALVGVVFSIGFAIFKTVQNKGNKSLLDIVIEGVEKANELVDPEQLKLVKGAIKANSEVKEMSDKLRKVVKLITNKNEQNE